MNHKMLHTLFHCLLLILIWRVVDGKAATCPPQSWPWADRRCSHRWKSCRGDRSYGHRIWDRNLFAHAYAFKNGLSNILKVYQNEVVFGKTGHFRKKGSTFKQCCTEYSPRSPSTIVSFTISHDDFVVDRFGLTAGFG
ncbi:hypothetical protein V6N12_032336 [Hibiscus sabdariffa]|uniref:Uncharacterized protein n=1 Tax=Hibiscus sabdariffa TaxID=183260 RepID=A0ABR2CCA7_9ROSI